jgi:coniferyl-aldehyde dehydrogenase
LPLSLVIDPPDDLALMEEEIFGPILPIKAYDSPMRRLTRQRRRAPTGPLRSRDEATADHVLAKRPPAVPASTPPPSTRAAIAAIRGSGQSGSGRHHGIQGSASSPTFAVFIRGEGDLIDAFAPP